MIDSTDRAARILVAYYSATGHVHALAKAVADGAAAAGADVRLRPVEELAPEQVISRNQAWGRHRSEVIDEPTASLDDLEWADGIAFGTPTRFGNVAAQLKMFLDQAGQLWQEGKLINKVATAFTSSQTVHGGQESTILALNNTFYHWGAIVLPLGYTVHEVFNGGGNPYGASYTSGTRFGPPDRETTVVAVAQGRRLARVAQVIGVAREHGLLETRAGRPRCTNPRSETVAHLDDSRRSEDSATLGERLGPAVSFATTEHFNLQTARVATISEANGRASLYLAALSSNLIALAFVGQMSRLGTAFYVFALILLPVLAFVGVVTFQRLVQSSIEDMAYARRIARLRAFYLGLAPELEPFLVVDSGRERLRPSAW